MTSREGRPSTAKHRQGTWHAKKRAVPHPASLGAQPPRKAIKAGVAQLLLLHVVVKSPLARKGVLQPLNAHHLPCSQQLLLQLQLLWDPCHDDQWIKALCMPAPRGIMLSVDSAYLCVECHPAVILARE